MTSSDMQATLHKLGGLPKALREELKKQAVAGSPILPASLVLENVDRLQRMLPVLSRAEAGAMLASNGTRAGVPQAQLVARLVPYLDENYPKLSDQLWELEHLCGAFGRGVIDQVMSDVNRARRGRGAQELLLLDSLVAIHQNERLQAQREGREQAPAEAADAEVLEQYPAALDAFLQQVGAPRDMVVVGDLTLRDLALLREVKQWIKERHPSLADPMRGDSLRYYRLAVQLLEKARAKGMGPMTAARRLEIRQQRAAQPNVLFEPLDGRGPSRWGGIYPNVRRKVTVQQSRPTGEVIPAAPPLRVLTARGELLLERYRVQKFGSFPDPRVQAQAALDIERERERLLELESDPPTWRWSVTPEQIGFELVDVEVEQDGPDVGMGEWGSISLNDALQQMARFLKDRGSDAAPSVP